MMTRFTVRVELHEAKPADYEPLHIAMSARGLNQTIIGHDGREFHLPPGEYNEISERTGEAVRAAARAAIKSIGKKGAILVTPSRGRLWSGLDEVEDIEEDWVSELLGA